MLSTLTLIAGCSLASFCAPQVQEEADPQLAAALESGLQWLLDHQAKDGHWDPQYFSDEDLLASMPPSDGKGNPIHSIGLTADVLLTLMDARSSPEHWQAALHGISWLKSKQRKDGLFGDEVGNPTLGMHLRATLAIGEYYRFLHRSPVLRLTYLKAVQFALAARTESGGWGFMLDPAHASQWHLDRHDGHATCIVTENIILALEVMAQATVNGIPISPDVFREAEILLADFTERATGRVADLSCFSPSSATITDFRPVRLSACWGPTRFFGKDTESTTAQVLRARAAVREALATNTEDQAEAVLDPAFELLAEQPPRWAPDDGTIDYPYWAAGARVAESQANLLRLQWRAATRAALLPHQRSTEPLDNLTGSWDPIGYLGHRGETCRVRSTALALRALAAPLGHARRHNLAPAFRCGTCEER